MNKPNPNLYWVSVVGRGLVVSKDTLSQNMTTPQDDIEYGDKDLNIFKAARPLATEIQENFISHDENHEPETEGVGHLITSAISTVSDWVSKGVHAAEWIGGLVGDDLPLLFAESRKKYPINKKKS